ncbi:MAG TPA: DNA methyltransferase, partial [Rubrivivax sp.]|nr:DNA methyltransferase [Rubrivivax sp.]
PTRAVAEPVQFTVDELLVVREFGEPIFPALVPVDAVANGPADAPWHTLIEADNYHALQLLDYLYAGQVDCIYIDPPYNTGARDWKYNNDYVDGNDAWRHSKWLSMMQRRLQLAKRLLNPAGAVLIVTIDEKEYLRLGLLLEQVFPGARVQMVSITISPRSTSRANEFSRVDEFAYFVFIGNVQIGTAERDGEDSEVRWLYLRRTQRSLVRGSRPRQFYPIYVDDATQKIVRIGEPLSMEDRIEAVPVVEGATPVYPIAPDGTALIWGLTAPTLQQAIAGGYVRVSPGNSFQPYTIAYLSTEDIKRVHRGEYRVTGTRPDGSKIVVVPGGKAARPSTVWRESRHDAGAYGTSLLRALIPGRKFPFPKSLYAVEDTLRLFVASKPNALVLDFFAGSGTTAHALMRLNRQDGGRRRCIAVTNNEVAASEHEALRALALQPGDDGWEQWGICRQITMPRLAAAITGRTPEGEPITGDYKFIDEFPMRDGFAANLAYFKLDFLDPERVSLKRAFREILPLLWLMAGAVGTRPELRAADPEPALFEPEGCNFVVLLQETRLARLLRALAKRSTPLSHVFIVTDSDESFKRMAAEVRAAPGAAGAQAVQLYRDYLVNFLINQRQQGDADAAAGAAP